MGRCMFLPRIVYSILYLLFILFFLATFLNKRQENTGFTWLIYFGNEFYIERPTLFPNSVLAHENFGYDGQHYAQLALDPMLKREETQQALDNFSYRSRRILFSWTAYLLGFGNPEWIVQVYAVQNAVAWLLVALLLLFWLPPKSYQNLLRYFCILFSAGVIISVLRALLDLPSLLLILTFALLVEKARPKSAIASLAMATLAKDHSVLCFAGLVKKIDLSLKSIIKHIVRLAIVVAPLFLWIVYVFLVDDAPSGSSFSGFNNFAFPILNWLHKIFELIRLSTSEGLHRYLVFEILTCISILTQIGYFAINREPKNFWWRVGAINALLILSLGYNVMQDALFAVSRVALPMTVAFNIAFPRTLKTLPILVLANLLVIPGLMLIDTNVSPERNYATLDRAPLRAPETRKIEDLRFSSEWYQLEHSGDDIWRWSQGNASIELTNPLAHSLSMDFQFELLTIDPRTVSIRQENKELWTSSFSKDGRHLVTLSGELTPGINRFDFLTEEAVSRLEVDPRNLAFAIRNFRMRLKRGENPLAHQVE